jgi:hypothetical protein
MVSTIEGETEFEAVVTGVERPAGSVPRAPEFRLQGAGNQNRWFFVFARCAPTAGRRGPMARLAIRARGAGKRQH